MGNDESLTMSVEKFRHYLMSERGLSQNTLEAYTADIWKFASFLDVLGKVSYDSVCPADIIEFMVVEKARGIAINSLSRNVVAIKMFFRFLAEEKLVENDVAHDIDTPRLWKHLPEVLTQEEVTRLVESPDITSDLGVRDRAILEMLYASGMRISEVLNLRIDQLDIVEQFIICRGKGSKERLIPIGNSAIEWAVKYMRDVRPKLSKKVNPDELFITRLGRKFTRQGMWKLLRKYLNMLGGNKMITPHTIRHTFATHLLINGAEIRFIQAMMGHANISTTQIYTHVDIGRLKSIHKRYHPRG